MAADQDTPSPVPMKALAYPERYRSYEFPDGAQVVIREVVALHVSESGTHRLKTADRLLHIVPPGWNHIVIDADAWSL